MQSALDKGMTVPLLHCFTVGNHELFLCIYLFLKSAVAAMLSPSMSPHNWTRYFSFTLNISTIMNVTLHEQVRKSLMVLLRKSRNWRKIKFPKRWAVHHLQTALSFDTYIYTVHYFFTRSKMFLFHSWIKFLRI